MLTEVKMYRCSFCNKEYRTPNRHKCKKDSLLKNCFTCKHLNGWYEDSIDCLYSETFVECNKENQYSLTDLKQCNYNLKCDDWEEVE